MSEIQNFYDGKNIFITGGTGAVGKILVEKLLRTCPGIGIIYLLIRTKRGTEPKDRLEKFLHSDVFNVLKKSNVDYKNKIVGISGDIGKPNLGISYKDREIIKKEVSIVFIAAATVRFDEPLPVAASLNVNSVKEVIVLCHECEGLKAAIYVSTAYSYCVNNTIKEELYPPPMTFEEINVVTHLMENQYWTEESKKQFTKGLLGNWPNTYSFTKAIAEGIVAEEGKNLPLNIFRLSIGIASYREPLPGWTDNLLGFNGLVVAVAVGAVHVTVCDPNANADIVPIDMACNALISSAWETAIKNSRNEETYVYNYVSGPENPITWGNLVQTMIDYNSKIAMNVAVYYIFFILTKSYTLYVTLDFLLHRIPALLVDLILRIFGKQPMMHKIYKKAHKVTVAIIYFLQHEWIFENYRVQSLWESLSDEDKKLFPFSMAECEWQDVIWLHLVGMKKYILKEDMSREAQKKAFKRRDILNTIHYTIKYSFFTYVIWMLWKIGLYISSSFL
ncbi:fatty acyl-CoA reductase wat-like [Belonocnema kinseyi]|uniref:fatty acyl-CoA reductase wat-like n=1 Tax=Belonocnema kinseyi TaxID=2817044 RepID=UPI00143DFBF7|nr:fatty acyl-CoA reductase wat-like [Belonocnema kinseyi]